MYRRSYKPRRRSRPSSGTPHPQLEAIAEVHRSPSLTGDESDQDKAVLYRLPSDQDSVAARHPSRGRSRSHVPDHSGDSIRVIEKALRRLATESTPRQSSKRGPYIKLPTYYGSTPLQVFLNIADSCRTHNGWTEDDCLVFVKAALRERAAEILIAHGSNRWTWAQLRYELEQRFGSDDQAQRFRDQLKYRRRQSGEKLQDLYTDVASLSALALP